MLSRIRRCATAEPTDTILDTRFGEPMKEREQAVRPDAELDLRGVICPYNFVKTKLKLETMEQGQILSVILDAGDPIRNVPMSVSNEGHEVLSQEPLDASYRVMIRRQ
jgi:tRNA 2-thiouridine synthesizing protein A